MPGEGQIHAAETGAGFSVAGVAFNPLKPKRESACFYENMAQLPGSLAESRECFTVMHLPPGFGPAEADEFALPRTNERGLCLPPLNFFIAPLF